MSCGKKLISKKKKKIQICLDLHHFHDIFFKISGEDPRPPQLRVCFQFLSFKGDVQFAFCEYTVNVFLNTQYRINVSLTRGWTTDGHKVQEYFRYTLAGVWGRWRAGVAYLTRFDQI